MPPQFSPRFPRIPPKTPNKIRRYRLAVGLTQKELARRLGISASTVSQWERGLTCPAARLLLRLAKVLNTLAEALYPQFYLHREGQTLSPVAA